MVFTHDTETALLAAVALVNSAEEPDTLLTTEDLTAFLDEYDYTGVRRGDRAYDSQVTLARSRPGDLREPDRFPTTKRARPYNR